MLGAWLFADNSSRAPGAPWGGAVGMPSLRVARHGDEGACGTARRSRASRQGGGQRVGVRLQPPQPRSHREAQRGGLRTPKVTSSAESLGFFTSLLKRLSSAVG